MGMNAVDIAPAVTLSDVVRANIRAEAARRGWNQTDLAGRMGMDRAAVGYRYRGRTPWTLDETERAARVFGLPFAELCAIRDSNPEPADYELGRRGAVLDLDAARASRSGHDIDDEG